MSERRSFLDGCLHPWSADPVDNPQMNTSFLLPLAASWTSVVRRLLLITFLAFGFAAPAVDAAEIGANFNSYNQFTANAKFLICTYAVYQSGPQTFTSTTDPWILNPIFVNQTVIPNPSNGQTQINYTFFDDFVSLQP